MSGEKKRATDDALLNLEDKSLEELRGLLDTIYEEEQAVSYRRRVLHGKIDILRAELVGRLKSHREAARISPVHDIERLIGFSRRHARRFQFEVAAAADDDVDEYGCCRKKHATTRRKVGDCCR